MEYLEVSTLYLARSFAKVTFVMEPLVSFPIGLPIMDAIATEAIDGGGGDMTMPVLY